MEEGEIVTQSGEVNSILVNDIVNDFVNDTNTLDFNDTIINISENENYLNYIIQFLGLLICIYGIHYFKRYGFLFTIIITLNYYLGTSHFIETILNNITISIIILILASLGWRSFCSIILHMGRSRKLLLILIITTIILFTITSFVDYFFYDFEYFMEYLVPYSFLITTLFLLRINPFILLAIYTIFGGTHMLIGNFLGGFLYSLAFLLFSGLFLLFQALRLKKRRNFQVPGHIDHVDLFHRFYYPIRSFTKTTIQKLSSFISILYLFISIPPFVPVLSFYLSYLLTGVNIFDNSNFMAILHSIDWTPSKNISIGSIFLILLNLSMLWMQLSWNIILFTSPSHITFKSKRLFACFWVITIFPMLICILWSFFNSISTVTIIRILICWSSVLIDTLLPRCELSQLSREVSKHYRKMTNQPSRTLNQNEAKKLMTKLAKSAKTTLRSSNSDDHSCVVCMEREREVVFECGHFICCEICAKDCITNQQICPLCRANSITFIKVWR